MLRMNEFAISLNVFEKEQCFVIFFFLLLFFHLHRVILLSGALHVCNCGFLRKSRYVRKVVIRTYKGSTVAGLARRTSKEGVLISPSTINLESFDIDADS